MKRSCAAWARGPAIVLYSEMMDAKFLRCSLLKQPTSRAPSFAPELCECGASASS